MEVAEGRMKPPLSEMFTDIYEDTPPHLQQQAQEMQEHISRHENYYHDGHGH
jgi:2-oxoisovalerate dehydrogenase E1 component alpha subunit